MTADVIDLAPRIPRRVCALCGRTATRYIDLVNVDTGADAGKKFLCADYPYCEPGMGLADEDNA